MRKSAPTWDELIWGSEESGELWELFHENSKSSGFDDAVSNDVVVDWMARLKNSLSYSGCPTVELPTRDSFPPFSMSLGDAIVRRHTPSQLKQGPIPLSMLASLLFFSYGINRTNEGTWFPRPFRNVPSGGGLFPLELYILVGESVAGLSPGLYHYNPEENCVRRVREDVKATMFAACLYQPEIINNAAIVVFQTALFRRSTFKYKDRGYRFTLIEAGHVAQNLNLVATALGLGVWNIGGFQDRGIDRLLGIDGVNHASVYLHAIGYE